MKTLKVLLALSVIWLAFAFSAEGQSRSNRLFRPCPASTTRAIVDVERDGDIQLTPCPGRSIFAGAGVSITNATLAASVIADNVLVRGDGGVRGVQGTGITVSDLDKILIPTAFSTTAPSLAFQNTDLGFTQSSGNALYATGGGGSTIGLNFALLTFGVPSTWDIGWSASDPSATGSNDTGLKRHSAGVIKSTNGSTAITGLYGGGAAVASAAALPLPTGNLFHVTGTTTITSITTTNFASGVCWTMIFDGILTVTDNNTTLNLAGNFVTTADDTLSVCFDGTNIRETARSVN